MGSACCKSADEDTRRSSFNEVSGLPDDEDPFRTRTSQASSKRHHKRDKAKRLKSIEEARSKHLEDMMLVLFNLHDLNANGLLEEDELVQLNSKVAMLHHGKEVDIAGVKAKYRTLFREKLHPDGQPVQYATFRRYVLQVLDGLDPDPLAQEMIVEQFAAEARSARAVFHVDSFASQSDQLYLSKLTLPSFASVTEEPSALAPADSLSMVKSRQQGQDAWRQPCALQPQPVAPVQPLAQPGSNSSPQQQAAAPSRQFQFSGRTAPGPAVITPPKVGQSLTTAMVPAIFGGA